MVYNIYAFDECWRCASNGGDASFLSASNSGSTNLQIHEYRTGRRGHGGKSEIQQITVSGASALSGFWRASFAAVVLATTFHGMSPRLT